MLSSAVLNLSNVLKTFTLSSNSAVGYSIQGKVLTANTVYANDVRGVSSTITIGTSTLPINLTGTTVVLDADTIHIAAPALLVDTTNMMITDNNIHVNQGGTTVSGAGIIIMSGTSTESAKLVMDSANNWLFTSPAGTVDVAELSAVAISTLTLSTPLISAAGVNFTGTLGIQGDLSATSATFTNLSVASILRSDRLDATTLYASNVSLGTLVSNTTLSVGTFTVYALSAPSVSISQLFVSAQILASLLSVQNMSIVQTNNSTTLGVVSKLFVAQVSEPATAFPQPMHGLTSLVHVFTPTFEINAGGDSFRFLSELSSNLFTAGGVTVTSDLAFRFLSGTRSQSAQGTISLQTTSGATVVIKYRVPTSVYTANQWMVDFGEDVDNGIGLARLNTNGYWFFSAAGSRFPYSAENNSTTAPVSNAFRIAAVTFSPSADALQPTVKTYDTSGNLRWTAGATASLTTTTAGFKMYSNQTNSTLATSMDIAAIVILRTEIASTDMPEVYRIVDQMQYGGIHMGAGTSFISSLSVNQINLATVSANTFNWPAADKTVKVYNANISTLNVISTVGGFIMTAAAGGVSISSIATKQLDVNQTGVTMTINGNLNVSGNFAFNGGSAQVVNVPQYYVNSNLQASTISVRDAVNFNTAPTISNVSVQNTMYAASLSAARMSVASFFAPSVSVGTTFGTPTVYTSTGFLSLTTNTLNTTSALYMSTLRFNTPTGLGPLLRMDFGNAVTTNGTATIPFATNMFTLPPTVLLTAQAIVAGGDVADVHTTSVTSTQFEVQGNLSSGNLPTWISFCWFAVGI